MSYGNNPTHDEIRRWLLHVVQHSCHVEYYLHRLGVGADDPQRPHDLVGDGNKFEWAVMIGLAGRQGDEGAAHYDTIVRPALELHRCQRHHVLWNQPNPLATHDDKCLGAVDAVCSLLEPRRYQGGAHSFEEILAISDRNPPHAKPWMIEMGIRMASLPRPRLKAIVSLDRVPNIGLPEETHRAIQDRLDETIGRLIAERRCAF